MLYANHSRGYMAAVVFLGFVYDIVENGSFVAFWHHAEGKRQYVGRNGAVVVVARGGVEILFVESLGGVSYLILEIVCIVGFAEQFGKFHHLTAKVAIERIGKHRGGGDTRGVARVYQLRRFGRQTPVAIAVLGHNAVLHIVVFHKLKPPFHGGVVAFYGLAVAETCVNHVGGGDESPRPCHAVGVETPVGGHHIGQGAAFYLTVVGVGEPFGIEVVVAEDIRLAVASGGAVAVPAHALVALRTVGGHAAVVAADSPIGVAVNGVNYLVISNKITRNGHLVVKDKTLYLLVGGLLA